MHRRSTRFHALSAACALLFAAAAHAAPKPLSDAEMSAVRGADGSIVAGINASSQNTQNPFTNGLAAAFSSSTGSTVLTPAEFAASLATIGLTPANFGDYAGQPVSQTIVDAKPVTFSFNLSDALLAGTGLQYTSGTGASMGTITIKDFDARGTTIWVWHH